jgi:ATP-dependent Lon protease
MNLKQNIIIPLIDNVVLPFEKSKIIINKKWVNIITSSMEIVISFYKTTIENTVPIIINENTTLLLSKYGTLCKVLKIHEIDEKEVELFVEGLHRVLILKTEIKNEEVFYGEITNFHPTVPKDSYKIFNNLRISITDILSSQNPNINVFKLLAMFPMEFFYNALIELSSDDVEYKKLQLEEDNIINGLKSMYQLFFHLNTKFKEEVEQEVYDKFKKNIEEHQKNYLLNEQIKTIKKELDKNNPNGDDNLENEIKNHEFIPENIKKILLKEFDKIRNNNTLSTEYTIAKNYIFTSLSLPWGKYSKFKDTSILEAEKILNEDHYGLEDVKENILEYLSTAFKTNQNNIKVLLLLGPPGVGKTSIGESIAKCLERKFIFISLNSISDMADLVGHRRTYVGAYPGQIINKITEAGVFNPLIFLDEVDKIKTNYNNPMNVLVSLLDSTQNNNFTDNFLGYGIDLSKCIFILTANSTDYIPDYLMSRMEKIYIDGYSIYEKVHIVKDFLLPKIFKTLNIKKDEIFFDDESILYVIKHYTREMGVRSLNKLLNNIVSKCIYFNMRNKELKNNEIITNINMSNIKKLIHKREMDFDLYLGANEIIGLAYTSVGGDVLKIQCNISSTPNKGDVLLTGKLGDVMKESSKVAFTLIKNNPLLLNLGLKEDFFVNHSFHIHVPEGAVPKDGPSAGVTLYTSLTLAIKNKLENKNEIAKKIGMTGEVSLSGEVLPIGGVKQKLLGAYMHEVKEVILPEKNRYDYETLKNFPKDIIVHFISRVEELNKIMFD